MAYVVKGDDWNTWFLCALASYLLHHYLQMFVCVLTFLMEILYGEFLMAYMMCAIRSLSRWLFWEEGCSIWFCRRRILVRLLVNMNMSVVSDFVCSIVIHNMYNLALKIFK